MGQLKFNTQSKSDTTYFRPNRLQIQSAVKGDDRLLPRRRVSLFYIVLAALGVFGLIYAATYFVLSRVLG